MENERVLEGKKREKKRGSEMKDKEIKRKKDTGRLYVGFYNRKIQEDRKTKWKKCKSFLYISKNSVED